jgi:hypothetical protein
VVDINYVDYERYQRSRFVTGRITCGDYCVFLDEGAVYNEGVKILQLGEMSPEKFFGALNKFFDHIERKFSMKVVVAAHPGIHYDKGIFAGREIYEGKTCELVKDCKLAIAQSSTANSFAVLYYKPLVFVYTDEYAIKRNVGFKTIEFLSRELKLRAYNIDRPQEREAVEIPSVDPESYDNYKYSCLTSRDSEGKLSKDIVFKSLMDL